MPHTDPISDMLTRIRNGYAANHKTVSIPSSKLKMKVLEIMVAEGYLKSLRTMKDKGRPFFSVELKYKRNGEPAITHISKVSKPGLRRYSGYKKIPKVRSGYGITILSTSKGILSNKTAKKENIGGELICSIY